MSLRFNRGLFPPGGWVYVDSTGVTHLGKSFAQLVSRVVNYRVINRLPMGDPAVEIDDQLCKNFPGYCRGPSAASRPKRIIPQPGPGCTSCKKSRRSKPR